MLLAARRYSGSELINISSGVPTTIRELVETVVELTGYQGRVCWDGSKPDGQMLKGFDVTRMKEWLAYSAPTSLRDGLRQTVAWFEANYHQARLEAPL
jgi:GDP-L-fucose synthase